MNRHSRRFMKLLVILFLISISQYASGGQTPALHQAAAEGDLRMVRQILQQQPNIDTLDRLQQTALMVAAANGHLRVTRFLVRRNADLHRKNFMGETALMLAVQNGQTNMVKWLLRRGGKPNDTDNKGWTALMLSTSVEISQLLIKHGANVNHHVEGKGYTPLMVAAEEGHAALVKLLLSNGANKILTDINDRCAAHFAREQGHMQVLEILQ